MALRRDPGGGGALPGVLLRGGTALLLVLLLLATALIVISPDLAEHFVFFPSRADPGPAPEAGGLAGEDVRPTAPDGVSLHGWWYEADPGAPAVLFFHGNAGNIAGRLPIAAGLVERGISVLLLDYRGYGRSAGEPTEEGILRDGEAALSFARERGVVPERTVLFGRSLGGAVAAPLAARRRVAGVILESTFTSLDAMAAAAYPILPDLLFRRLRGHFDVLGAVREIEVPKLFVHGTADDLVPPRMGRALHEAAGEPKAWYPVEGAGHNDVFWVGGDPYFDRLARFVRDVAGGSAAPAGG